MKSYRPDKNWWERGELNPLRCCPETSVTRRVLRNLKIERSQNRPT